MGPTLLASMFKNLFFGLCLVSAACRGYAEIREDLYRERSMASPGLDAEEARWLGLRLLAELETQQLARVPAEDIGYAIERAVLEESEPHGTEPMTVGGR